MEWIAFGGGVIIGVALGIVIIGLLTMNKPRYIQDRKSLIPWREFGERAREKMVDICKET